MGWDEAGELLTAGLTGMPGSTIRKLLRLTGRWPLLLSLVNGAIRRKLQDGADISLASAEIAVQIDQDGLYALDLVSASRRDRAVRATLTASLDYLDPGQRQRFLELAIFAEDADIPAEMADMLWAAMGSFSGMQARRLRRVLVGLGHARFRS